MLFQKHTHSSLHSENIKAPDFRKVGAVTVNCFAARFLHRVPFRLVIPLCGNSYNRSRIGKWAVHIYIPRRRPSKDSCRPRSCSTYCGRASSPLPTVLDLVSESYASLPSFWKYKNSRLSKSGSIYFNNKHRTIRADLPKGKFYPLEPAISQVLNLGTWTIFKNRSVCFIWKITMEFSKWHILPLTK